MKNLAILGHPTRGKEVIEILEMLGGVNKFDLEGSTEYWYVLDGQVIQYREILFKGKGFTLGEFLEKFPYKVGDKVKVPYKDGRITGNELYEYKILKIKWDSLESTIKYGLPTGDEQRIEYYSTNDLNIWNKKETVEEIKIDIPRGYEFAGVDDDNQQVVFTKKQSQYPKTYEECCKVLGVNPSFDIRMLEDEESALYFKFIDLVRCRNAYWKIAGKEMGLGKPWEPDFKDNQDKYFICYLKDEIWKSNIRDCNRFLVFPTEKIRDEFYENFKDLIEGCKNLI